jgi:hypothetical protein
MARTPARQSVIPAALANPDELFSFIASILHISDANIGHDQCHHHLEAMTYVTSAATPGRR